MLRLRVFGFRVRAFANYGLGMFDTLKVHR